MKAPARQSPHPLLSIETMLAHTASALRTPFKRLGCAGVVEAGSSSGPCRLALPRRFGLFVLAALEALFQRIHEIDDIAGLGLVGLWNVDLLALGLLFDELAQLLGIGVLEPLGIEWA
jgi:hypothetical protein